MSAETDKFAEPTKNGLYITKTGKPVYKSRDSGCNWGMVFEFRRKAKAIAFGDWEDVLKHFDADEFPLEHWNREQSENLAKEQS